MSAIDSPPDAAEPPAAPPIDRTISPVAGRLGAATAGKAVVLAALVAGCGVFLAASWRGGTTRAPPAPEEPARQVVPFEPLRRPPPTLAAPGTAAPSLGPGLDDRPVPALQADAAAREAAAPARTPLTAIRAAPLIAYSRGQGAGATAGSAAPADPAPAIEAAAEAGATQLDQLRRGSTLGRVRATRLPDRNFLIAAGTVLPCLLQTAMDTATPGYVSCLIPRDVFSDNGAVVLMEKGARVLGEYGSSLRQGRRRLFVLWTRAVTPGGVTIRLDSPAADALGRAGFDGDLDTHFWDRFGGALLLSVVDDAAYAVAGRDAGSGVARLPSDAAGIALQNSVNIPPSLRKAQGAEVSIFVAQDVDFSGVYGLKGR